MKLIVTALALAVGLATAAPANGVNADTYTADIETLPNPEKRAPRFSCGQYKFDDDIVQELYSQVWAGYQADQMICRYLKYESRDKKGQEGKMVAAKIDKGCTCFFYESPCDPNNGLAEIWEGWVGWQNYIDTDKNFRGWYCFEQN
ncbi:uncharacterized protein M421DRAFT_402290 [Didymella exigua CBS 183.55]|uniref:Uncharacterized protein n=1 Tax=Didymella exigua CBS 183.55 TaxID=1150837 RepID=A0A6A5R8H5_9PLEO|nr:uncharacterized protein M421DRAFT_402290 [Didymella exigua CBS 183.55]KAF1924505.1 hypothetical protein M421DRAFT_402290 [Didymella exigua CBS 183.55]